MECTYINPHPNVEHGFAVPKNILIIAYLMNDIIST